MPLTYTDEQDAFAETVSATLARHGSMPAVRRMHEEPHRWKDAWEALVALDVLGLTIPESLGGLELSAVEMAAVLEAAGASATPLPLMSTIGAFTPLLLAAGGADPAVAEILGRVVAGTPGTVGLPAAGPGLADLPRLAGSRLTGSYHGIPEASRAEFVAAPALREDDNRAVVIVGRLADLGVEVLPAMDPGSPLGVLEADDDSIGEALVLEGPVDRAWPVVWTAAAAELVGLGGELVRRSVEHARDRVQFGRPIGSFQAVKHQLVDAHLGVERARSLTMYAAGLASDGATPIARKAAHHAKAAASESASRAARTAVQVHGGVGITQEHDVSLLYLRARQLSLLLGSADEHWALAAQLSAEARESARR